MIDPTSALARCSIFAGFDEELLGQLAALASVRRVDTGELATEVGRTVSDLVVVAAGRFRIETEGREIAQLGVGDAIGEISLIDDGAASADARAIRPSLVVELPIASTRAILLERSESLLGLTAVLATRLRHGNAGLAPRPPRVVAVRGGSSTTTVIDAIVAAMPGARPASTLEEVWRLEPDHLVIVDGRRPEAVADVELLVRSADDVEPVRVAPRRLDVRLPGGPPVPQSPGASLSVVVDLDRPETVDRLLRLTVGGAETLVLGGGGWRTSATIGVIEELLAAGLSYDLVVGVSAMAPTAVLLGREEPFDRISALSHGFASSIRIGRDLWPSSSSITTGRSLTEAARHVCGPGRLEDLARPALIGVSSLTSGQLRGVRSGEAWRAVRASASLPVIFPPMPIGDELCVDGGVIDNLPTSLVYETLPDPIVTAVSVGRPVDFELDAFDVDGVAGRARWPSAPSQLVQLMTSCMRRRPGPPRCDHLIEPDVGDTGIFDASQFTALLEQGRLAGRAHLRERGVTPR